MITGLPFFLKFVLCCSLCCCWHLKVFFLFFSFVPFDHAVSAMEREHYQRKDVHQNDNGVTLSLKFVLCCSLCCCWHLWFLLSELFAVVCSVQTSVFIPVLGSSTSVIADSTMTSPVVIETLLEKFKVSFATVQRALVSFVHMVLFLIVCGKFTYHQPNSNRRRNYLLTVTPH